MPLVVKWPGQTVGERVPALAQQVDLLPTILRAAGLQPPAGLPGSDLFTLSAAPGGEAFSHLRYDGRDGMSVVADGWKLILPFSRKLGTGPSSIAAPPIRATRSTSRWATRCAPAGCSP